MCPTPNVRALHLYGGTMGTFLRSPEATSFDLSNHSWNKALDALNWLITKNPLFRSLCHRLSIFLPLQDSSTDTAIGGVLFTYLGHAHDERAPPPGRPDLILNPFDFDSEVRNEDHRSHRLPAGTIQSSLTEFKCIINHGGKN